MKKLIGLLAFCMGLVPVLGYAESVTASWDAVTAPDIAGYQVFSGTATGTYGPLQDAGNTTSFVVTGLNPGTHYFTVKAYDTSGNVSSFATEVVFDVTDKTAPNTPQNLTVSQP